jgi:hypothetical protein
VSPEFAGTEESLGAFKGSLADQFYVRPTPSSGDPKCSESPSPCPLLRVQVEVRTVFRWVLSCSGRRGALRMREPFWTQTLSVYAPNLAVIASMVRKLWVLALLQCVKLPSTSRVVGREVLPEFLECGELELRLKVHYETSAYIATNTSSDQKCNEFPNQLALLRGTSQCEHCSDGS